MALLVGLVALICCLDWTQGSNPGRPSDAPPIGYCPKNEKYVNCVIGYCHPKKCDDLGKVMGCPSVAGHCDGGCVCKDGYVRNCAGICIPKGQCPSCGGDPNAVSGCSNYCGKSCQDYQNPPHACPMFCKLNGCDCRKGYIYDETIKKCVLPENCDTTPPIKCPGAHEEYSKCNAHCQKTCETRDKALICTKQCQPGCVCKPGYIRDGAGNCIPVDDCNYCPKNEKYVNCVIGYCHPKKCDDLGKPIGCPGIVGPCDGGCVCKDGYVRNCAGICIPKEQCPSCGGDPNAISGCSNHCGNSCNDYQKPSHACPLFCLYNGCDCRKGYVYDETIKKCVLPENCYNKCGTNEHYSSCINACPKGPKGTQCKVKCIPGCICNDGYKRKGNKCVKKIVCCKHEHYSPCINPCPKGAQCFAPCIPGCLCDKGYIRKDGKCVKQKSCGTTTTTVVQSEESKSVSDKSSSNSESHSERTKRTDEDGTVSESSSHEHHEEEESSHNEESEKSTSTTTTVERE